MTPQRFPYSNQSDTRQSGSCTVKRRPEKRSRRHAASSPAPGPARAPCPWPPPGPCPCRSRDRPARESTCVRPRPAASGWRLYDLRSRPSRPQPRRPAPLPPHARASPRRRRPLPTACCIPFQPGRAGGRARAGGAGRAAPGAEPQSHQSASPSRPPAQPHAERRATASTHQGPPECAEPPGPGETRREGAAPGPSPQVPPVSTR
ncbi:mucin-1-like [Dasypus novemcinctus]|uniref:mucin-1-like n=1 Tax=Dasypus novemcinctus TaxID=9361 RepID=UPI0039C968EB